MHNSLQFTFPSRTDIILIVKLVIIWIIMIINYYSKITFFNSWLQAFCVTRNSKSRVAKAHFVHLIGNSLKRNSFSNSTDDN